MHCSYSNKGNQSYNPESLRIKNIQCGLATATVTTAVTCVQLSQTNGQGLPSIHTSTNRVNIPVIPGSVVPSVNVGTIPASATVANKSKIILSQESNPYNPDTRFRQYFPTPPIPYQCPERIPNNYPKPSTIPCLPIQRFQGSSKK